MKYQIKLIANNYHYDRALWISFRIREKVNSKFGTLWETKKLYTTNIPWFTKGIAKPKYFKIKKYEYTS